MTPYHIIIHLRVNVSLSSRRNCIDIYDNIALSSSPVRPIIPCSRYTAYRGGRDGKSHRRRCSFRLTYVCVCVNLLPQRISNDLYTSTVTGRLCGRNDFLFANGPKVTVVLTDKLRFIYYIKIHSQRDSLYIQI